VTLYDITVLVFGLNEIESKKFTKALMKGEALNKSSGVLTGKTNFSGRKLKVVKSPCIINFKTSFIRIIEEVKKSIEVETKGYHAFLLVLRYSEKMTLTISQMKTNLKLMYGPNIMKKYVVLVLTHDNEIDEEKLYLSDWLSRQDKEVKRVFKECDKRVVLFNLKTESCEIREGQIKCITQEIDNLQFNGRRYTLDEFREAETERNILIVQENELKITEETLKKCKVLLESSDEIIKTDEKENIEKMFSLYTEALSLKENIVEEDCGTNVLIKLIKDIDNLINTFESLHKNLLKIEQKRNESEASHIGNQSTDKLEKLSSTEMLNLKEGITVSEKEKKRLKEKLKEIKKVNQKLEEEIENITVEADIGKDELKQIESNQHDLIGQIRTAKNKSVMLNPLNVFLSFLSILIIITFCVFYARTENNEKSTCQLLAPGIVSNCWSVKHNNDVNLVDQKYVQVFNAIAQNWKTIDNEDSRVLQFITSIQNKLNNRRRQTEKRQSETKNILLQGKRLQFDCDAEHAFMRHLWLRQKHYITKTAKKLNIVKRMSRNQRKLANRNVKKLKLDIDRIKLECNEQYRNLTQLLEIVGNHNSMLLKNLTEIQQVYQDTKYKIENVKHSFQRILDDCKFAMNQCRAYQ
ncbi:GTPase IMAP family member 7, partial [Biomphalaria glabrata]